MSIIKINLVFKIIINLCGLFFFLFQFSVLQANTFIEPLPTIHVSSKNTYAVRIEPAQEGEIFSVAELYKNQLNRFVFKSQFKLKNSVAPVLAFVTNQGELITIDDWGNNGKGDVIYLYHQDGSLKFKYELSDLVPFYRRFTFKKTMSAIHWVCSYKLPSINNKSLKIIDSKGGGIIVDLSNGKTSYKSNNEVCSKPKK